MIGAFEVSKEDIGGRTYTVRTLNLAEARGVYVKLAKIINNFGDDIFKDADLPVFMMATFQEGVITEADLTYFCTKFGAISSVDYTGDDGEPRMLSLSDAKNQDAMFKGDHFPDMFTWLDLCVRHNFASAIAKIRGGLAKLNETRQSASKG